ncbi:MAG: NAD(P)/FAD-dependent oxidoreductase [Chloroflexi bacterium]|nr:NAD(P)/FAD-dependent oxidoreductase [Chloroflexota bacterium]
MKHVIVGSGVAGITAAQTIIRADPSAQVHVYGAEPYLYYRRPLLWEFIAGQIGQDDLYFRPAEWYTERNIHTHTGVQVTGLVPSEHTLTLVNGETTDYDRLLLATGGRPFIPPCEGIDKKGVFALRTLADAQAIKAYAQKVSTAVVIGGGLLGLETARALQTAGLDVTVVEFFPHLLPRQLDAEGAGVLQSLLEAQGLKIVTDGATESVQGNKHAHCIWLQDNRTVPGELVIFSTGIRSETTLAQTAELEVNRGIVVDEQLRTSEKDIFAAGDAAEFKGRVYGIITPAIEQARVAATNMVTPGNSIYAGTLPATTLKVAGAELTSLGEGIVDTDDADESVQLRHVDLAAKHYRKFVLRDGRIVGAILLNDKVRVRPISQLIKQGVDVSANTNRLLDDDFDLKSLL